MQPASRRTESEDIGTSALEGGAKFADKAARYTSHKLKQHYKDKLHNGPSVEEGNPYSKKMQQKIIERECEEAMAKKGKKKAAEEGGKLTKNLYEKIEDLIENIGEYIVSHPKGFVIALLILLLILLIMGCMSSCAMVVSGGQNVTIYSSYTAKDRVIKQVNNDYIALENGIRDQLANIESVYTGYDRYDYDTDSIGHNPHALASILTVVFEDYERRDVQDYLNELLSRQYSLWVRRVVETRTRTVTKYHYVTYYREVEKTGYKWENRRLVQYTYTVEEPYDVLEPYEDEEEYEYYILKVTLRSKSLEDVVEHLGFTDEQLERYGVIYNVKGNKPDLFD